MIKGYDYFISHSSKDSISIQKLIQIESRDGNNVYCDWISDVDYLKRHLVCRATLNVIKMRMQQSNAMIFLISENSLNSDWCKYELNYFNKLGKPIYCISIESINEQRLSLEMMKDNWFLDPDYENLALIESKNIQINGGG